MTQEEVDAHLAWYPEDKWLSRSRLELVITRTKQINQEREEKNHHEAQREKSSRKKQREQNRRVEKATDVFRSRGVGAEPPPKRPFNWELERQKLHQQHIQDRDKKRKNSVGKAARLQRKCAQQRELEEHALKAIRQEEQQVETDETADNGLSRLGSLANLANTTVEGREPSPVVNV